MRLVKDTDLVTLPNSRYRINKLFIIIVLFFLIIFLLCRGESILLFLVQTVGRQNQEQRQFRRPRTASVNSRNKTPSSDGKFFHKNFNN